MEPLYPFAVTTPATAPFQFIPGNPPEEEIAIDANRIYQGISAALPKEQLIAVCRFVRCVIANTPLYVGKKHQLEGIKQSVIIIPNQQGKTVFISLGKTIPVKSGQQLVLKEIAMLSFDHQGRLAQTTNAISSILKLVTCFTAQNPEFEYAKRRISVMQKMHTSPYFPTNYGFVLTESKKVGTKLSIFQERAKCDLATFEKRVMPAPSLPLHVKLSLCKTVVCGLRAFHSNMFLYRDLKFDNILVFEELLPTGEKTWRFKLTDFGLTCSFNDLVERKRNSGTLEWVAPEMFYKGSIAEPENDLWSLGLIIHFLFTQTAPGPVAALACKNGPNQAIWKKALATLPPPPERIMALKDLVPALLQENPKLRLSLDKVHEYLEWATADSWCSVL